MFLSMLSDEIKKEFISLCIYAANANGVFEESERNMILEYCNEMKIVLPEKECRETLKEVMETIKNNSTESEKRIITLELLGLLYADDSFDYDEEGFLNVYISEVGITGEILEEIKQLFEEYLDIYKRMLNTMKCN